MLEVVFMPMGMVMYLSAFGSCMAGGSMEFMTFGMTTVFLSKLYAMDPDPLICGSRAPIISRRACMAFSWSSLLFWSVRLFSSAWLTHSLRDMVPWAKDHRPPARD